MTFQKIIPIFTLALALIIGSFQFGLSQDCPPLTRDSITDPGVYSVGILTESDSIRNGPGYSGATIYYPIDATPPFASIAIVPGFVSPESTIQDWGPFYASHGIVTMTIGTNSLFDDPARRAEGLLDALKTIKAENLRLNSPLYGKLDTTSMAVSGWSMGGGGAQLAAVSDTTIKAVVALCPWLDNSQLNSETLNHPVPLLILSGEVDAIAPPGTYANAHYANTPETTDKLIYEVRNGDHRVANGPIGGQNDIGKVAISWLRNYLIGDDCYCPLFLDTIITASHFATNVTCLDTTTTSVLDQHVQNDFSVQLFPNPSHGTINVVLDEIEHGIKYEIFSFSGGKLCAGNILQHYNTIDIQDLPSGAYFINIIKSNSSARVKFVVL